MNVDSLFPKMESLVVMKQVRTKRRFSCKIQLMGGENAHVSPMLRCKVVKEFEQLKRSGKSKS